MIRSDNETTGNLPETVQAHWYECPRCQTKDHLELVEIDVIMSSKIVIQRNSENDAFEAELGEISGYYDSNPDRIQCGHCGHLLKNQFGQNLNCLTELELFLERGGKN